MPEDLPVKIAKSRLKILKVYLPKCNGTCFTNNIQTTGVVTKAKKMVDDLEQLDKYERKMKKKVLHS